MTQDRSSRMSIAQGVPVEPQAMRLLVSYARRVELHSNHYLPPHVKEAIEVVVEEELSWAHEARAQAFFYGIAIGAVAIGLPGVIVWLIGMTFNG